MKSPVRKVSGLRPGESCDVQWASESGFNNMLTVAELEAEGWSKDGEHVIYKGTWLMVKFILD